MRTALKKGLGQHLLKDGNLLAKMARLAGVGPEDVVVEIGPGEGDLTRAIAARARSVYAVEIDESFAGKLRLLEEELPHVKVIFSDALVIRFSDFGSRGRIIVMGNIPYYLTGEILFKLLEEKEAIKGAYLTMQREVAERIASPSHCRSYGALSVIFRLYAAVKVLFLIKPGLFIPPPKVESAFVSILFNEESVVDRGLIGFVKHAFRHKRKYLRNSLVGPYEKGEVDLLYEHFGFAPSVRAEEIEPETFVGMYRFLAGTGAP